MKSFLKRFAPLLAVLVFAGCSTISSRIDDKAALFATLTPHQQEVIRKGGVELGYTPDMVYMALGAPDERHEQHTAKGDKMTWVYLAITEDWAGQVVRYRHYAMRDPKTGVVYVFTEPEFHDVYRADAHEHIRIEFTNGKVSAIEREKR